MTYTPVLEPTAEQSALLTKIHGLLGEVYQPAGVLIFWSSRIKYLDGQRPCDLYRDHNWPMLETLASRLDQLADGNF